MLAATTGRVAWMPGRERSEGRWSPRRSTGPSLARSQSAGGRLPLRTHLRPEHVGLGVSPPVRVGAPCGINRSQSRSRGPVRRQDDDMDVESGWDLPPGLDEFLLARIAEDSRMAADAAAASGRAEWSVHGVTSGGERGTAGHIARYDPARIKA